MAGVLGAMLRARGVAASVLLLCAVAAAAASAFEPTIAVREGERMFRGQAVMWFGASGVMQASATRAARPEVGADGEPLLITGYQQRVYACTDEEVAALALAAGEPLDTQRCTELVMDEHVDPVYYHHGVVHQEVLAEHLLVANNRIHAGEQLFSQPAEVIGPPMQYPEGVGYVVAADTEPWGWCAHVQTDAPVHVAIDYAITYRPARPTDRYPHGVRLGASFDMQQLRHFPRTTVRYWHYAILNPVLGNATLVANHWHAHEGSLGASITRLRGPGESPLHRALARGGEAAGAAVPRQVMRRWATEADVVDETGAGDGLVGVVQVHLQTYPMAEVVPGDVLLVEATFDVGHVLAVFDDTGESMMQHAGAYFTFEHDPRSFATNRQRIVFSTPVQYVDDAP